MRFQPQIIQYAWSVPDLDAAARQWFELAGVGPFLVIRDVKLTEPQYRGSPSKTRFSVGIAQHGDAQIELIAQQDDTPSAYRDTVPKGTTGFHHVGFIAEDYDAAVEHYASRGYALAANGRFGTLRYAYFDTSAAIGHMVEVIEDMPQIRTFFGAVREAAESWDGDPATLMRELG